MDAALHEQGKKLIDLYKKFPGDFNDKSNSEIVHPDPKDICPDGSYYRTEKDIWGVEWEYTRFGIAGHPKCRPLDDLNNLKSFKPPELPQMSGVKYDKDLKDAEEHKKK